MHKRVRRIQGMLQGRRGHVASLMALALSWYALVLYVPSQLLYGRFLVLVVWLIVGCLALAVRNFILPGRWGLIIMGAVLIALLVPGPLFLPSVQNEGAVGSIEQWVWQYSVLVAGAGVASYLSFKAAGEHKHRSA